MNSLSGCLGLICLAVEIAAHCEYLFKLCLSKFSYLLTLLTKELVMVRDGVCCLSLDEFASDDLCTLISYLSVQ